jgi:heat shock protein HslJ
MAIALVLVGLVLVSCGGTQQSENHRGGGAQSADRGRQAYEREEARAERRARELGFNARQAETFATVRSVCGEEPKSEFAVDSVGLPADSSDAAIAHGYASEWPRRLARAVFEGCMEGLATVSAHPPPSSPSAHDIWGRNFVVTSVGGQQGGDDPPVNQPPEIRLGFSSERGHAVFWEAQCNSFGGDVHFTATQIKVERVGGTLVGCFGGREREDQWLSRFMESGPEWHLAGTKLTLASSSAEIELKGFRDPGSCPISPSGGRIDFAGGASGCEIALGLLALYAGGKGRYMQGWQCRREKQANGLDRVLCRESKARFTAKDFDLESLRRGGP